MILNDYKRKHRSSRLYDSSKIDFDHLQFDRSQLWALLIPLMLEQLLNSFMGMADSMMVARVGSAAISSVSLVDSINTLVIQVFEALAAGGTILCSQYLGRKQPDKARNAAEQIFLTVLAISTVLTVICLIFNRPLLRLIFGSVETDVMNGAVIYFYITAASYPFMALFQAGSAFYRAGGNSRFPTIISIISNVVNIIGNAILIFGFNMGVAGAALSTLGSRVLSMFVLYHYLAQPGKDIVLKDYRKIRPQWDTIGRALSIGVPAGVENGMFQFGKLAIQSSVSTLGTEAIAAQAMTVILENLNGIASMGIGIGLMTVVGQCIGAGSEEEAKYYIVKLTGIAEIVTTCSCLLIYAATRPVLFLAGMTGDTAKMCIDMMTAITIAKPIVWTLSFIPAYGLRAAGDVKFCMITSMITMWAFRVSLATFLIRVMGFGPIAVWIGMFVDWTIRGIIFSLRFMSGNWLQHHVI